jgi:hypothetical protein
MSHLFIVGAQRSGSTYLYHILDDHPKVTMSRPVRPEPKFFLNDQLYAKGRSYYEDTYFGDAGKETRYLGEKSTSYIESIVVANRIHQYYPDARILMILRDPVIRAYSNYRFSVEHKLESLTFEEALRAEPMRLAEAPFSTSVNPYAYCKRGHYINYIEAYLKVFSHSQLKILIFEEFVSNLESVQHLYRWLGIDDSFEPESLGGVYNPTARKDQDHSPTKRTLALEYQESLVRLENLLGRRLEIWRRHWETL